MIERPQVVPPLQLPPAVFPAAERSRPRRARPPLRRRLKPPYSLEVAWSKNATVRAQASLAAASR